MHGDKDHPSKAVLLKEDYEKYYYTHEPFVALLNSELITKSFLFVGFSFTDPNINYVFGRLTHRYSDKSKDHYCIMKKCSLNDYEGDKGKYEYETIKQQLFIEELKRYRVQTILIENYPDLTLILKEIEKRYNSHSVFISGSAIDYGDFTTLEAHKFIHTLSKKLVERNLTVVNGFGLGVGSAVINGALDAIYSNPKKYSEEQLVLKPFPQFKTGEKELDELWEEYRQQMISRAGIIIFVFGNKDEGKGKGTENAGGVKREFLIALEKGLFPIPIHYTGYMSEEIFNELEKHGISKQLIEDISKLQLDKDDLDKSVNQILNIIDKILK